MHHAEVTVAALTRGGVQIARRDPSTDSWIVSQRVGAGLECTALAWSEV